jgi:hypothetical protein
MSDAPQKPKTLDERLDAITMNLELLSHDFESMTKRMAIQDKREREGRRAIMVAMNAYLQALDDEEEEEEE